MFTLVYLQSGAPLMWPGCKHTEHSPFFMMSENSDGLRNPGPG